MLAHFEHGEIYAVNSGISLKGAIRYIIEFMILICESSCMFYAYVWEDNPLAKLVDYLPYKCTTIL